MVPQGVQETMADQTLDAKGLQCPLPVLRAGNGQVHANLSVWMIGGEPAGIAFRESLGPVTGPAARFVPHILRG